MDLRKLVVSSYPPDRCGIAKYTVQYAAARRREGEHVEIVSTKRSGAHHRADMMTWHGCLRVLALSRKFDRMAVQFFPDLLMRSSAGRQFIPHWPWLAAMLAFGPNVEMIVHESPYETLATWPTWRGRLMRRLWRSLYSLPKKTYVHSKWERDSMIAATGVDPRQVEVLEHGSTFVRYTETGREAARVELGLEPDKFHFLAIGFIQPHKGFDRAVHALGRLSGDRARLHVVGSTRVSVEEAEGYLASLHGLIAETPAADLHEEFVSDEEFDRWIVACDAVVLPYRRIVSSGVLERAKLYGRPAIVTDVGGLRDQASAADVVVADDDELARAMARLAEVEFLDDIPVAAAADPQARLHAAATRLRHRYEGRMAMRELPESEWEPTPEVELPSVHVGSPLRKAMKKVIRRLTWWELQPLLRATIDLRSALIDEHEELRSAQRRLAELTAGGLGADAAGSSNGASPSAVEKAGRAEVAD